MQLRRVRGRPHRQDVRVHGTHLHHVGVVWLVAPAGGVVVDVQDGDVHLEHGTTLAHNITVWGLMERFRYRKSTSSDKVRSATFNKKLTAKICK